MGKRERPRKRRENMRLWWKGKERGKIGWGRYSAGHNEVTPARFPACQRHCGIKNNPTTCINIAVIPRINVDYYIYY